MKKENFDRLMESARQALEHAEGKRELWTTVVIETAPISVGQNQLHQLDKSGLFKMMIRRKSV